MSTIDSVEGLEALPQDSVIRVPTNGDVLVRCGAYWFCVGGGGAWASASLDKDLPAETLHPRTVSKTEVRKMAVALVQSTMPEFMIEAVLSSPDGMAIWDMHATAALAAMGIEVVDGE